MASTFRESHLSANDAAFGTQPANPTVLAILFAISFSHLLNDTIQSLIPAIYPLLKTSFHSASSRVGLDHPRLSDDCRNPANRALVSIRIGSRDPIPSPAGMGLTLGGLVILALPGASRWSCWPPRSSDWARRFSIRNRLASRTSLPAAGAVSRNRFSRSGGNRRQFVRPAPRRAHRRAVRAGQCALVRVPSRCSGSASLAGVGELVPANI